MFGLLSYVNDCDAFLKGRIFLFDGILVHRGVAFLASLLCVMVVVVVCVELLCLYAWKGNCVLSHSCLTEVLRSGENFWCSGGCRMCRVVMFI